MSIHAHHTVPGDTTVKSAEPVHPMQSGQPAGTPRDSMHDDKWDCVGA